MNSTRFGFSPIVLSSLAAMLISCAVHDTREDWSDQVEQPEAFSQSGDEEAMLHWWEEFEDPILNQLMDTMLRENLSLRAAGARLDQAKAVTIQAGVEQWPTLSFEGGAGRARTETQFGESTDNQLSLTLNAAYEVDLWKRIYSQKKAAEIDLLAVRKELENTALALSSRIASLWFRIVELRAQKDLLHEQVEVNQKLLESVRSRFGQGLTSAVDVYQQKEQIAAAKSQIPLVESQLQVQTHQLAVLLGKTPKNFEVGKRHNLPGTSDLPNTGIPADLLMNRPDVRAAHLRVAAVDHRIAEAIADRFPALRLSARSEYQGNEVSNLFSQWIWNIAANLFTPMIDGHRRQAEILKQKATLEERLAQFEETYLESLQDVEDALVQEARQREHLKEFKQQLEHARSAYEESRIRYLRGVGDFLTVFTQLRLVQNQERDLLQKQRELIEYRINLYNALGGAWTQEVVQGQMTHNNLYFFSFSSIRR